MSQFSAYGITLFAVELFWSYFSMTRNIMFIRVIKLHVHLISCVSSIKQDVSQYACLRSLFCVNITRYPRVGCAAAASLDRVLWVRGHAALAPRARVLCRKASTRMNILLVDLIRFKEGLQIFGKGNAWWASTGKWKRQLGLFRQVRTY